MKPQPNAALRASLRRKLLQQLGILAGLSLLLGFTFNSANPIGVRWGPPQAAAPGEPPGLGLTPEPSQSPPALASLSPAELSPPVSVPPLPPVPPEFIPQATASTATAPTSAGPLPTQTTWAKAKASHEAGEVVLVDSRAHSLYQAGHIPGALSLPILSPPEAIEAFKQQYPSDSRLVVYCGSQNCTLSKQLATKLVQEHGFENVQYIQGGYRDWQQDMLLARSQGPPIPAAASVPAAASPQGEVLQPGGEAQPVVVHVDGNAPKSQPTSWTRVKPRLERGEVVLIDARPRATFEAAHIPGAISLPHGSPPQLIEQFKNQYPPDTAVVVYCGSQSCSLSKQMADQLVRVHGFTSVEYMTGGFQEWQRAELQNRSNF